MCFMAQTIKRPSLDALSASQHKEYTNRIDAYMSFLRASRTPHEGVEQVIAYAKRHGFGEFGKSNNKGFYLSNSDGTAVAVVRKGKVPVTKGMHIIGAHLDSPCLTAKIHPIREKPEGVVIDCFPYGGIYLHQWFDTRVSVVGHCIKKGKSIRFELPGQVLDMTIHLSGADRVTKKYDDAFDAESLDVFVGYKDKKSFLQYMKKQWGIDEQDFARSMLVVVPQGVPEKLSDLYLTGFGQDDKVCSFAQLEALCSTVCHKTGVAMFFDREEIGSTGYNGALSRFFEQVIDAVLSDAQVDCSDAEIRKILQDSLMISADVDVAYNSNDIPYSQEESASKFGEGLIMDRHNGGRSQSYGNNVSVALVDRYMEFFKQHKVVFKVSAIPSKVNTGGGGTIAMYFAHRGIPVVDMGVPVVNMHGKHSVVFLPDVHQMINGFKAFYGHEVSEW